MGESTPDRVACFDVSLKHHGDRHPVTGSDPELLEVQLNWWGVGVRRRLGTSAIFVILVACGNPIDSAGNCTELLEATGAAGEELPDGTLTGLSGEARAEAIRDFDEQWNALQAQVEAKGQPMMADAIARGAELEALLCADAINESHGPVARVFERIAGELSATTTAP